MPTWADVEGVAPEAAGAPAAGQITILALATKMVDPEIWGDLTNEAIIYLAAHLGTLSAWGAGGAGGSAGAAGPVVSESLGPMSRSYANVTSSASSSWLGATKYGAIYEGLLRTIAPPMMFVP